MSKTYSAGIVTAYGAAKRAGYQGTYEDFCRQQAGYAGNAAAVETAKNTAVSAANTATTKATEATTAATAAQTAKVQTEQLASQALTDIETARTGAISAVQTEGQTQTANARAQAQAAAQSATTASTKASEASASATTATTKATEAAASATSAANAASAAQAVLNSIPEDYSDLSEDVVQLKADLANVDNHTAKSAEQLISDKRTTDKVPYKYRASQSGKSDRAYDMIVGGTVCFNQLIQNGDFSDGTTGFSGNNGSVSASNGVLIFTASSGTGRKNFMTGNNNTAPDAIVGHKYFYSFYAKVSKTDIGSTFAYAPLTNNGSVSKALTANTDTNIIGIRACTQAGKARLYVYPWGVDSSVTDGTETCSAHDFMLIDLTSMFGTTIADHIYALEQATAGAGVALFRAMFADDYYPYNVGSLVSVEGLSAKEAVGFNRFDKSTVLNGYIINDSNGDATAVSAGKVTDYIPVIPEQTYYTKSEQASGAWGAWYDADKNYISGITGYRISDNLSKIQTAPANARYMRLTCFYNNSGDLNTFCVNVSNPARNGEYEPYVKHTYPLDNSLTLRGVPVLKDGKIEFDGDIYEADGTVTRRYAERAYQSGDESLANAITDGTNTVYKLSVKTTETAIPYASPQIVAPYGTEEYISETICPVGHVTEYPDNLRAKLDGLPWDLSMVAPVEVTYTATRNYTVNQLLIVNNTLYKVTANIANGGTITPDTNVIATTLSEVIASLT